MSDSIGHNGGPPIPTSIGNEGWVAIARSMRSHWLVGFGIPVDPQDPSRGSYSRAEAWIDLIMECRYAAGTVSNGGHRMELRPGQLLGPTSWLATRWNWTPKTVRGFIDKLATDGMIELFTPGVMRSSDENHEGQKQGKQKGKQGTIITICNHSEYQVSKREEGQAEWHAEGEQGASKGQARGKQGTIYSRARANKETIKQGNNNYPPTPFGDEPEPSAPSQADGYDRVAELAKRNGMSVEDLEAAIQRQVKLKLKSKRREASAARNAMRREDADKAFDLYNKAATHFGFAVCESMTDARRTRLLARLDDIGGVEAFRRALWAIRKDDFLVGRTSKPGTQPFRLDIDRLLSTKSGLGDVLARLLDLAGQPDELVGPNGKRWGWWRDGMESLKALDQDVWRRRLDAVKPNGTWPWWELGAPPGHEEAVVHPDVVAERKLVEIYQGKINHD